MEVIVVRGGAPLSGEVTVSGAKNAALPLLFASLLTREPCTIGNLPRVADVRTALELLRRLGVKVSERANGRRVVLQADAVGELEAPYELVKTMRASFLVLGPLVARFGRARVSTPGGCAIGARPVDYHLAGLSRLGATVRIRGGYVEAEAGRLRGTTIVLEQPSVGATEQLMMAAALAEGTTVISNAAREPEIVCLAAALRRMGAEVEGAGTSELRVGGRSELGGAAEDVIPDRIEAGTWLAAGAITGGEVLVRGARADHLGAFISKLAEAGVSVRVEEGGVRVLGDGRMVAVDVRTLPFPGFPTDLQAQMMALMTQAEGRSVITETVFENRFLHAQELVRMGAEIRVGGNQAVVRGPRRLSGAPVMATDLRASVSLVLAGLVARGTTEVARVYHLDRGYENLEGKLAALGAEVRRERRAGR